MLKILMLNRLLLSPHHGFSCPVDSLVFPELGRSRDNDALEARFNAFKIPESNFLVFEATVRTCRGGCQPVSTTLIANLL